jgi:hypothetical protein
VLKFGVRNPCRWRNSVETWCSDKRLDCCVCCMWSSVKERELCVVHKAELSVAIRTMGISWPRHLLLLNHRGRRSFNLRSVHGGQNGTGRGLPPSSLVFLSQYYFTSALFTFIHHLCYKILAVNLIIYKQHGPGVDSASNRNEYQEYFLAVKLAGT